jgi:inosose dehydratase
VKSKSRFNPTGGGITPARGNDSRKEEKGMLRRREFLGVGLGAAAAAAIASAAPANKIRWAISGNILFGRDPDIEKIKMMAPLAAKYHFTGIEPFTMNVSRYLDKPAELKAVLDPLGLTFSTVSGGGDFVTPEGRKKTIEESFKYSKELLVPMGCKHLKVNIASGSPRKPEGTSIDDLKTISVALNELGKRVHEELGLKFGFHPHLGSAVENEEETAFTLAHTDPKYVGLVPDTCHLAIGGMDPVKIVRENWSRVVSIHIKDAPAKFRPGNVLPTPEERKDMGSLFTTLGSGGVDFPAFFKLLKEKNYDYWVDLDYDPPRPGQGTIEENLEHYTTYLQKTIKVWNV